MEITRLNPDFWGWERQNHTNVWIGYDKNSKFPWTSLINEPIEDLNFKSRKTLKSVRFWCCRNSRKPKKGKAIKNLFFYRNCYTFKAPRCTPLQCINSKEKFDQQKCNFPFFHKRSSLTPNKNLCNTQKTENQLLIDCLNIFTIINIV